MAPSCSIPLNKMIASRHVRRTDGGIGIDEMARHPSARMACCKPDHAITQGQREGPV
jgi:hypothetical protein